MIGPLVLLHRGGQVPPYPPAYTPLDDIVSFFLSILSKCHSPDSRDIPIIGVHPQKIIIPRCPKSDFFGYKGVWIQILCEIRHMMENAPVHDQSRRRRYEESAAVVHPVFILVPSATVVPVIGRHPECRWDQGLPHILFRVEGLRSAIVVVHVDDGHGHTTER